MGRVTLKPTLAPEANIDKEHVVRIRITKDRMVRYWPLNITLPKKCFNDKFRLDLRNWVKTNHPEHEAYNARILEQLQQANKAVSYFEKEEQPYTSADVVAFLKDGGKPDLLIDYFKAHIVTRRKLAGSNLQKLRTADQYEQALNRLTDYLTEIKKLSLPVRSLTEAFVLSYQTWMLERYAHNTVSLKLACLRKVSRLAMKDKFIPYDKYPFENISIVFKNKAVKRLREGEIEQLADSPRTGKEGKFYYVTDRKHARPCAMLMYLMQGMRIGDFVLLRRSNYVVENKQPRIIYEMGKSDKPRNVLLPPEAVDLLAPYLVHDNGTPKKPKEFLFPYIIDTFDKLTPDDQLKYINRAVVRLSMQIKTLGEHIGLDKKITPHIMRHSYADMLRREGVDLITAQMSMGHSDMRTTRRFYMEEEDQAALDTIADLYKRKTIVKQIADSGNSKPLEGESDNAETV